VEVSNDRWHEYAERVRENNLLEIEVDALLQVDQTKYGVSLRRASADGCEILTDLPLLIGGQHLLRLHEAVAPGVYAVEVVTDHYDPDEHEGTPDAPRFPRWVSLRIL
jgi:hypothetical protein